MFLTIWQKLWEVTCAKASFLIKLQAIALKKWPWHKMFSCEFSEIFKNTYFEEHLRTTASENHVWYGNRRFYILYFWPQYCYNCLLRLKDGFRAIIFHVHGYVFKFFQEQHTFSPKVAHKINNLYKENIC